MNATTLTTPPSSLRARRIVAACAGTFWGASVVYFALWLKTATPERGRPWLAALMASEPFHIAAHIVLYGVLTALAFRATSRRWASLLVVAVFAIVQEGAQSVWWGRPFGPGEYFDLAVDAVAAGLVLAVASRSVTRARTLRHRAG